jgi:hypothetical protein
MSRDKCAALLKYGKRVLCCGGEKAAYCFDLAAFCIFETRISLMMMLVGPDAEGANVWQTWVTGLERA